MRIVYSRRAVADVAGIAEFLRLRNPAASADVGAAIRATIRRIARHPRSGRLQDDGSRKSVVLPYGYLIFYDVSEASIEILTVQHGARRRPAQDA